jgi:hypothetical protein
MNNNSKKRAKLLNGPRRVALFQASNPRNRWNTEGKVARGKKGGKGE